MPAAALEAPEPGASRSTTTTCCRAAESSRASAQPITPAPTTTTSAVVRSITVFNSGIVTRRMRPPDDFGSCPGAAPGAFDRTLAGNEIGSAGSCASGGEGMPDSVEAVAVSASRAKIVESLVRLGRAVHKTTIYPEGHPAIPAAVASFIEALRQAVEDRPALSLGVASDRILVEGEAIETKNSAVSWLAQHMHERGIGAVDLARGLPEAEGVRFV